MGNEQSSSSRDESSIHLGVKFNFDMYMQSPTQFAQNSNQGAMPGQQHFERQRAPYSYAREDLRNINRANTPSAPNLNPNLNRQSPNNNPAQGFVFVNRNGQPERQQHFERQRAPYSYAREDLRNINRANTPSAPNLYPNLNRQSPNNNPAQGSVFVNRNGQPERQQHLERQRAPYSYAREDLQNINRANTPSAPNLYPNLNRQSPNNNPAQGSVFVNRNGQPERAQPSAPGATSRDRSASRNRSNKNDNELNCPTCKTMFSLQIHQCNRGHSSCKTCKDYGRQCGICGNDITTVRNFALEAYIAEKKVPCPHNSDGCTLSFKMSELDIHVKECPFKELQCPLSCSWKGSLKQLSKHFDVCHPQQRSADVDSEMRLTDISRSSQNIYLVVIGAFHFLFHVKVSEPDRKIYMTAQLIGTKISASKWSYEVHVYNKNESRRKFTFTDTCTSSVEPVLDIFKEDRCSVLPHAYATTFVNNGALTYKFFIKKSNEYKNPRGNFGKNQRGKGKN